MKMLRLLLLAIALVTTAVAQDSPRLSVPLPKAGNYSLSPNDVVVIRVFREPTLDSQCRIGRDGTINFPLLGLVTIAGKTANDAAAHIAALLDKDYIIKPQVSLSIVAYSKQTFNVLGQVNKPGGYAMPEERSMDLLSAIAEAGGFTRLANQSKVTIRRQVDGRDETFTVDAAALAKDQGAKEQRAKTVMILPNDTITVPERFF